MRQYIVDAFTDRVFSGNPAAVCVMEDWLSDGLMQDICRENNLSETAFTVQERDGYRLRWFTPGGEIDLCGHATLATAYVICNFIDKDASELLFYTLSGELSVKDLGGLYELDLPAYELKSVPVTDEMEQALGLRPKEAFMGRDMLCILDNEEQVKQLRPDMEKLRSLKGLLLHVSAGGSGYDCVSRSFAPKLNVDEDPVCGSGHCHIVPYWLERTGKDRLLARQASRRGGTLQCRMENGRVFMAGKAALFSQAEIFI